MSEGSGPEMTVVSGTRITKINVSPAITEGSVDLRLSSEGQTEWNSAEPSWRPISLGSGLGVTYLWSARRVIVLPTEPGVQPTEILEADEDLLVVFRVASGWLLVCESSIRLCSNGTEVDRVELGDVVNGVRWEERGLAVADARGVTSRIVVEKDRLITTV